MCGQRLCRRLVAEPIVRRTDEKPRVRSIVPAASGEHDFRHEACRFARSVSRHLNLFGPRWLYRFRSLQYPLIQSNHEFERSSYKSLIFFWVLYCSVADDVTSKQLLQLIFASWDFFVNGRLSELYIFLICNKSFFSVILFPVMRHGNELSKSISFSFWRRNSNFRLGIFNYKNKKF